MKDSILLEVSHITKVFPGVIALNDVSLQLQKGEILGICGENGAGKSTLLKIVSGAYQSGTYQGTVRIDGEEVHFDGPLDSARAGIAIIYQEILLMDNLSVADNIMIGNYTSSHGFLEDRQMYEKAGAILEELKLPLDPRSGIRGLNTGKRQLIAIAKALASHPRIILLDEPTSALTDTETKELFRIIRKLRDEGISCVYISHKMDELFELCDRLYVMRDGMVVREFNKDSFQERDILESMVGRTLDKVFEKDSCPQTETVLEVSGLSTLPAPDHQNITVKDISFSLHRGEILGFAGLVGSGRSETVNALFGADRVTAGTSIRINGKQVRIKSPLDAIRNNLALITEDRKASGLVLSLPIKENIILPSLRKLFRGFWVKDSREEELVEEYYKKLRVKAVNIHTLVHTLSGGNQQKVILAREVGNAGEMLVMDQPTRGLDLGAINNIHTSILDERRKGKGILLVSTELSEIFELCDRIAVIYKGAFMGIYRHDELTTERIGLLMAGYKEGKEA